MEKTTYVDAQLQDVVGGTNVPRIVVQQWNTGGLHAFWKKHFGYNRGVIRRTSS
jgi:hypothetical protein